MTDKYNYNVNKDCIERNGDFFAYLDVVDAHKIVKELNSQDAKIKELKQTISDQQIDLDFLQAENQQMRELVNRINEVKSALTQLSNHHIDVVCALKKINKAVNKDYGELENE